MTVFCIINIDSFAANTCALIAKFVEDVLAKKQPEICVQFL